VFFHLISGHCVGRVNTSELKMTHYRYGVKTPVSLPFEGIDETVKVKREVIPAALFPVWVGALDKEGFNF